MAGVAGAVGAELDPFLVVSFGIEAVVTALVDIVARIRAPRVLTAAPAGRDAVVGPVDAEVMVDVDVEVAAEVVELFDGAWLTDAADGESGDEVLDGSAHAVPWEVNRAAPTASAIARAPIRPTHLSPRTRQLYR